MLIESNNWMIQIKFFRLETSSKKDREVSDVGKKLFFVITTDICGDILNLSLAHSYIQIRTVALGPPIFLPKMQKGTIKVIKSLKLNSSDKPSAAKTTQIQPHQSTFNQFQVGTFQVMNNPLDATRFYSHTTKCYFFIPFFIFPFILK